MRAKLSRNSRLLTLPCRRPASEPTRLAISRNSAAVNTSSRWVISSEPRGSVKKKLKARKPLKALTSAGSTRVLVAVMITAAVYTSTRLAAGTRRCSTAHTRVAAAVISSAKVTATHGLSRTPDVLINGARKPD